jgi:DUF4097 and DUF4098 domain-containing protein YvlB
MRKVCFFLAIVTLFLFSGIIAFSQENPADKATVPFSNPSKPGRVEASVHNGGIIVKGYEGKEVIVEARAREKKLSEEDANVAQIVAEKVEKSLTAIKATGAKTVSEEKKKVSEKAAGMRLIETVTTGLTVEEENNVMDISVESFKRAVDLIIQVPYSTSLELSAFNNGDIVVENVSGEIEVNNHNGALKLSGVSGVVIASTFNGDVTVNFIKVSPEKPMSFSTWNGDIDVTFPADIKARVKMKSQRGDIYSDFDIKLIATPPSAVEDKRKEGGKYRISLGEYTSGTINGGGPEFQFNTFNGNIFIRKAK